MKYPIQAALTGFLGALCCVLGACNTRTDVSLTGNTPAQYSHVYVTAQEVWFHTSATAGPDDSGWVKFPLSTPTTVDLVADQGGTLGTLATSLKLLAGTYSQIRLIPVDASAPLSTSAQTLGAVFNSEVDFVDSASSTQQLPLELLNPDKGIGIPASLRVSVGGIGVGLGGTSTTGAFGTGTNDATSSAGITDATTTGTTTVGTTNTTSTTSTTGTTSTTTTIASFAINMEGRRDLVPFTYSTPALDAILLSSHATAYDLSTAGGIQGTLTLTSLNNVASVSGQPAIQVDAETLSADGTRHVVVLSTTVHSDGTFLLYPLPSSTSTPASYDVVIHGPGIATIIIKSVEVVLASSSTTLSPATTNTSTNTNTSTTTSTTTSTAATTTPGISTVSIGTLLPRAASAYTANIAPAANSALPPDALVSFYQTLAKGEVPYVIEASPIDPFNQNLFSPQGLSEGTIDSGTYVSSGETVTVISAAPLETAGHYLVAASAPFYADGPLTTKIGPPTSGTNPVIAPLAALSFATGASVGSVVAVVTPATPAKYDHGELLVSHEGALVGTAVLNSVLAQGGNVSVNVPAGTPSSVYYVSVRVWNSNNPSKPSRQWFPTVVDLRSSSSGTVPLSIN